MDARGDSPSPPPPPRRRTGSFPLPQRREIDTQRYFADRVRHVPPRYGPSRGAEYYREPEDIDPYVQAPPPPLGYPQQQGATYAYPGRQYQFQQLPYGGAYAPAPLQPEPAWYAGPGVAPLHTGHARRPTRDFSPRRLRARSRSRSRQRRDTRTRTRTRVSSRDPDDESDSVDGGGSSSSGSEIIMEERNTRGKRFEWVRRRHGDRYDYGDESTDGEGEYDQQLGGKVYSFTPMRDERRESRDGNLFASTENLSENLPGEGGSSEGAGQEKGNGLTLAMSTAGSMLHVFASKYTGDTFLEGNHSARLTEIHDPKRSRQSLFRWLHLQRAQLNLDELSAEIARVPGLSDTERHGFTRLLSQVRDTVKTRRTADGRSVKHMTPGSIQINIQGDNRSKGQKENKRLLTWLCLPYFSLEKYSGLMAENSTAGFPVETLLQSDYAPTDRPRDMEQVVVRNGAVPEGECFHIAQVWCVVLDNSLLITCGRMSSTTLQGNVVEIATEPLMEPETKARTLYVSYYDSVLWALPLDSCLTWFAFATHFHEFWPQAVRFYHRNEIQTENDWPNIVHKVRNSNTRITIDVRLGPHPQPPTVGVLQPLRVGRFAGKEAQAAKHNMLTEEEKKTVKPTLPERVNDKFHVFTWMDTVQSGSVEDAGLSAESIIKQLEDIEGYLLGSTAMSERRAYQSCNWSSRKLVHAYLEDRGQELETSGDDKPKKKQEYDDRVDLYNAAELVFRFFLPWQFEKDAPTIGKFWGTVQNLVEMPRKDNHTEDAENRRERRRNRRGVTAVNVGPIRTTLRSMTRAIQSFQTILSHVPAPDRLKIEVPNSLVLAWLHLIMALVQSCHDTESWQENMDVAEALIRKGMGEIMDNISTDDLLENVVIQPMELISLMSWKLLQDSVGSRANLNDTYSEYMKKMQNDIEDHSDRSHQYRISQLKKEIEVIRRVISSQQIVVSGMFPQKQTSRTATQNRQERAMMAEKETEKLKLSLHRPKGYYEMDACYRGNPDFISNREPDEFSKLSSTDPGGFAELLVRDCRSWLERKDNEFLELYLETSRLEGANTTNLDITKDRQEKAVYAFTMVTIIFLPLSTISSIFGMNTSDIANLELGQWVYWATALPTTLAVIVGGLWWMGELENLMRWLFWLPDRRQSGRGNRRGYALLAQQPADRHQVRYGPPPPAMEVPTRTGVFVPIPQPPP